MINWDEAEAKWLNKDGELVQWNYTFDEGKLIVEVFKKDVDGKPNVIFPVRSDVKLLHKSLVKRFGKHTRVKGTFNNEGNCTFTVFRTVKTNLQGERFVVAGSSVIRRGSYDTEKDD